MTMIQRVINLLHRRRNAYRMVFTNVDGDMVLKDLAVFCRANESCFHPDERVNAVMEGRREVWLRIQHHLKLTDDQLMQLYANTRKVNDD